MRVTGFSPSFGPSLGKLHRKLKKRLYTSSDELNNLVNRAGSDERYLGSLPKSWIDCFNEDEIGRKTKEAEEIFARFAEEVYKIELQKADAERLQRRLMGSDWLNTEEEKTLIELTDILYMQTEKFYVEPVSELKRELQNLLQKRCEVKYSNSGSYGCVFEITTGFGEDNERKKFALKVFRPRLSALSRPVHGKTFEPASVLNLNYSMKSSQCAKLYCAKITTNGQRDGFILTDYVEDDRSAFYKKQGGAYQRSLWFAKDKLNPSKYRFLDVSDEFSDNIRAGKLVDFGGVCYRFQNKKQHNIAKELYPLIKKGDVDKIKALALKYKDDEDFNRVVSDLGKYAGSGNILKYPLLFTAHARDFNLTKEEIAGFRVLGFNYDALLDADLSDLSMYEKIFLNELLGAR